MRHCPDCGQTYPAVRDICPDCWERLDPGRPPRDSRLRLVFTTNVLYEAEMIETLLANEGIPCLKIPAPGATMLPVTTGSSLTMNRLYVHRDMLGAARDLITEVTGEPADA